MRVTVEEIVKKYGVKENDYIRVNLDDDTFLLCREDEQGYRLLRPNGKEVEELDLVLDRNLKVTDNKFNRWILKKMIKKYRTGNLPWAGVIKEV